MTSSCSCKQTSGVYGGTAGTSFVDIATNPCNVQITDIWIGDGEILDSLKMGYRFSDGQQQVMPRRGGPG